MPDKRERRSPHPNVEWTLSVDRMSETHAVLFVRELDERLRFELPIELLPHGTREGDIVRMGFSIDPDARLEAARRIQGLLEQLTGDDPLAKEKKPPR